MTSHNKTITEQQEESIAEAWRMLHMAATEGKMVLKNGTVFLSTDFSWSAMIQLFRQMAALKPPKSKHQSLPEDFKPQSTRSKEKDESDVPQTP